MFKHKILFDNGEIVTASNECFDRMGFKKGKTYERDMLIGDRVETITTTEYHTTHKVISVREGEYRRAFQYPNGHLVYDGSSSVYL